SAGVAESSEYSRS
ncbi:hypothetical protein A2U01_0113913, partial [Trifolium medium]|nr:hypothetical protein [Trifolium medium]